ncbi:MAG: AAA family ATPase [Phycicoccus sp.]
MLNARRALALNAQAGRPLPKIDELGALYARGVTPRHGEVIMIAGRPGAQKSGFALWWTKMLGLRTLYLSADMSAFQAGARLACMQTGYTLESVESLMAVNGPERGEILRAMSAADHVTFKFGSITWEGVDYALEAYIELHNAYPEVIVIDNLMDIQGVESDYKMQMEAMQVVSDLSRETGSAVIVLHHASDKSRRTEGQPWLPPARNEIKNGLAEKPELALTVALDPRDNSFNVACVKQRMGPCDPSGETYTTLQAWPEHTRFGPRRQGVQF